ncbi:MAG: hypothetical protein NVS4B12_03970 [Ktedonobacteraceae bacterium]
MYENRDTQAKYYWQDRIARERLNISESVEETLADASSQEEWSNEEQKYVRVDRSTASTELVPPRLSLQSKVLPSVRPVSFVQSATAEIAAQQGATLAKGKRQKSQNTNILTRFAQRFTSSLAAFGAVMQPEVPAWSPSAHEYNESQERYLVPAPPTYVVAPIEVTQASPATVIDAIPATPSVSSSQPVKSKQRLAGHTAKVRLQNAPTSKVTSRQPEREAIEQSRESREPIREPLVVNVRLREKVQDAPISEHTVVKTPREEVQTPAHTTRAKKSTTDGSMRYASFFGTGSFESEQGEVMVKNTRTTASSVVHVTLTSHPGPTLLQYVSLRPEVGFTLHLTAPAAAKTTFNYVLLVDTLA